MALELSGTLQNSHGTLCCYPEPSLAFKAHCAMCAGISKIFIMSKHALLFCHTGHDLTVTSAQDNLGGLKFIMRDAEVHEDIAIVYGN